MLRKRSRPTAGGSSTKQGLMMSDSSSPLPSPAAKFSRPIVASLFPSPRLFATAGAKDSGDGAAMSPTSILENKSFTAVTNPFFADRNNGGGRRHVVVSAAEPAPKDGKHIHHRPWENGDSGRVGLGIVDALKDDLCDDDNQPFNKSEKSRMVLFGSQLKIQIPPIIPTPTVESPRSPIEFGIKTKSMVLGSVSPIGRSSSPLGSCVSSSATTAAAASPRVLAVGSVSPAEMELSEDYTCVIVHGPNPRTTHIFDNCIVEMDGHGDDGGFATAVSGKENGGGLCAAITLRRVSYPSDSFLSFCYACKKALGVGEDIYMYRGDRAFCSHECRYQEMLLEEGTDDKGPPPVVDELY